MLHGHNARVEIDFTVTAVDPETGFAIDFSNLKLGIGNWIDRNYDHRTLLQDGDPIAKVLETLGEPFVRCKFRPTAENIAATILLEARDIHGRNISVVRLWETPSSFVEVS